MKTRPSLIAQVPDGPNGYTFATDQDCDLTPEVIVGVATTQQLDDQLAEQTIQIRQRKIQRDTGRASQIVLALHGAGLAQLDEGVRERVRESLSEIVQRHLLDSALPMETADGDGFAKSNELTLHLKRLCEAYPQLIVSELDAGRPTSNWTPYVQGLIHGLLLAAAVTGLLVYRGLLTIDTPQKQVADAPPTTNAALGNTTAASPDAAPAPTLSAAVGAENAATAAPGATGTLTEPTAPLTELNSLENFILLAGADALDKERLEQELISFAGVSNEDLESARQGLFAKRPNAVKEVTKGLRILQSSIEQVRTREANAADERAIAELKQFVWERVGQALAPGSGDAQLNSLKNVVFDRLNKQPLNGPPGSGVPRADAMLELVDKLKGIVEEIDQWKRQGARISINFQVDKIPRGRELKLEGIVRVPGTPQMMEASWNRDSQRCDANATFSPGGSANTFPRINKPSATSLRVEFSPIGFKTLDRTSKSPLTSPSRTPNNGASQGESLTPAGPRFAIITDSKNQPIEDIVIRYTFELPKWYQVLKEICGPAVEPPILNNVQQGRR